NPRDRLPGPPFPVRRSPPSQTGPIIPHPIPGGIGGKFRGVGSPKSRLASLPAERKSLGPFATNRRSGGEDRSATGMTPLREVAAHNSILPVGESPTAARVQLAA